MNDTPERPALLLTEATLTPLVRMVLADEQAQIANWTVQTLKSGFSGAGVYRLLGQAQGTTGEQPWSLVLKVLTPALGSREPTAWNYWQREELVYRSAIFHTLPPELVAPHCYAITNPQPEEVWLWLEDMADDQTTVDAIAWPLERFALAAYQLGLWNGKFLVDMAPPLEPWWRTPDVQQRLALAAPGLAQLTALRQHPLFAPLLSGDTVAQIQHLWAERDRLLTRVEQLPQTLCHRDAGPLNFMSRQLDQRMVTIALDWGMAGRGMLGEELVPLFAATLQFVEIELGRIAELERANFAGYLAGLRAAGWQGDERLVRFGFTALAALKNGVADPAIKYLRIAHQAAALPAGAEPPRLLSPGGYAQAAALQAHLLTLGEEALTLAQALPAILTS